MLTRIPELESDSPPNQPRRGTTVLEYLMMLSLIVVVALVGIGYFGSATNSVTKAANDAISKSVKGASK